MKIVFADFARCFGCGHCAWICAFRRNGDFKADDANIWVEVDPDARTIFTITCFQCERASCLIVCPTGALQRDPQTRAVVVIADRCIGCKLCITACSFGNIHFDQAHGVAVKCDLCHGDPQCVKFCMAKALQYAEMPEGMKPR